MIDGRRLCTLKGLCSKVSDPAPGRTHVDLPGVCHVEAHVPAQQSSSGAHARLPDPHAHPRRPRHLVGPPRQGPHAPVCLTCRDPVPLAVLPTRHRLTSSVLIKDTIRHGRRARRGRVVAHVIAPVEVSVGTGPARAAFAVGKSVGNSVDRHRVVRQLRAIVVPALEQLPAGSQVVIRALPEAQGSDSSALRRDVHAAISKASGIEIVESNPALAPDTSEGGSSAATDVEPPAPVVRTGLGRLVWLLGWPIRALLLGLIWIYRNTISPILPPTCRYHPSYSAYAFGALQTHGAAKGTALAAWRVLRCNPFTPGGLDPVPTRGRWKPDIDTDGTPRATPVKPA